LEVAALKVPLIASDIPENREVLPDQALYFRSGDVDDLRKKLQWALAHPDEIKALTVRAYQSVVDNYRWPTVIRRYEELYEENLPGTRKRNPVVAQQNQFRS
jgi:glycosyltransferase involved in cell wall biosynthesis